MKELTLIWTESGQQQHYQIRQTPIGQYPVTTRIGRDPNRCDLVLCDPTISGLHVEIFFDLKTDQFRVRNLRSTNPAILDGQSLRVGDQAFKSESQLILGQQQIRVFAVISPPQVIPQTVPISPPISPNTTVQYGLRCPTCGHICSFEQLGLSCQWCGTTLAAAESVVLNPNQSL